MSAAHPVAVAAAAESGVVQNTLLTALIERFGYDLKASETLADLDQSSGNVALVVRSQATGHAYVYDPDDSTTADDGISCLVDANGLRYKIAADEDIALSSVLAEQNTPPGSPNVGDKYIVGASPTGAWVGHEKDIGIWLAKGWVFVTPLIGLTVLNQATDLNVQYNDAGAWRGLPIVEWWPFAISSHSAAMVADTAVVDMLLAFDGEVVDVRASLKTASSSGGVQFDINIGGASILSTEITIDQDDTDSADAATPPAIDDGTFAAGDGLAFDIDDAGTGAVGGTVYLKIKRWLE